MAKCWSFTASRDTLYRYSFNSSGLKSSLTNLGDGTTIHCWIPKTHKPDKPNLLLIHGFGANAMWQWSHLIGLFTSKFNLYVPDLLFFGESFTTRLDRSESFQAQCLGRVMMEVYKVRTLSLVGLSYGGFVGYSLAEQFEGLVERVVVCCAGVCLEEKDLKQGLFRVSDLDEAVSILLPQTPEKMKVLVRMSFVKPAKSLPSCFLRDFIDGAINRNMVESLTVSLFRVGYSITTVALDKLYKKSGTYAKEFQFLIRFVCGQVMCTEYVQEKRELLAAVLKDRKLSDLPRITQPTLIIWGDQDQIFPLELGHRLKSHIGENAELVIIKDAGHAVNMEKPKRFYKHLKDFLINYIPNPPTTKDERDKIE
ncbi:hypothetical protein GIB67_019322 [Kingdonia uniflora]|uniref:AB hydrolase-1 domain-containing protein n=1 Tax=Kingdonia uniflora TaxID=39325 RepID=A0A7J7M1N9_9MAGN|nr:hypothetical protein GIB67_019322 [Kingdonia uniflora]